MKNLLSLKALVFSFGLMAAAIGIQDAANAGTLEGAISVLKTEGYSSESLSDGKYMVSWRAEGQVVYAVVAATRMGVLPTKRLGIVFVISDLAETISPRQINSINQQMTWVKLYVDDEGDGIIERYEAFLEDEITDMHLAVKIAAFLDEAAEAYELTTSQSTS